ncbi:AMP-binding protein [Streptomyces sp. NPDC059455]|uniref:AMP-binding protein n=1 Tax=Streptomyces sp. NPDC059455 TaxID=3346837 RepID=UPI003694548B
MSANGMRKGDYLGLLTEVTERLVAGMGDVQTVGLGGATATGGTDLMAELVNVSADEPGVPLTESDPMLLLRTSGTTGRLKAATHAQGSYAAVTANILASLLAPGPDSGMLHAAALIHAIGTFVLPYSFRGGTSVVQSGFEPRQYLEAIEQHRITEINLVLTMLGMLFTHEVLGQTELPLVVTVLGESDTDANSCPRPRARPLYGPSPS